jgi:quercetin dioxygenase-like cupin family protein
METVRLLDGRETRGTYAVVRCTIPPKRLTPVLTHSREDIVSYVLAGTVVVVVDGDEFKVPQGMFAVRPAGLPHAVWNASDHSAVLLETVSPPGFDAFFDDVADLDGRAGLRTADLLEDLRERYGLVYDAERVNELEVRHGLQKFTH